jgi:hypothetical protein
MGIRIITRHPHSRPTSWVRRPLVVAILALLLAALPGPAHAAPLELVRISITDAEAQTIILCVPMRQGDQSLREDLLAAPTLPGLIGVTRAHGGGICAEASGAALSQQAQPVAPQQAGLVIDFGDGRILTFCIDLGADGQATGEEVLRASGLPVIMEYAAGMGGAVCMIDGTGGNFPSEPCFAKCTLRPGEACVYWSYSRLVDGRWRGSPIGASTTVVRAGEVNGWAWGSGSSGSGALPPPSADYALTTICAAGASTATATPSPTPSATPTATAITLPSATTAPLVFMTNTPTPVLPTATPVPTSTPVPPTPTIAATATAPATALPTVMSAPSVVTATPMPTAPSTAAPVVVAAAATPEMPTPNSAPAVAAQTGSAAPGQTIWLPLTGSDQPPTATALSQVADVPTATAIVAPTSALSAPTTRSAPAPAATPAATARAVPEPASDTTRGYAVFGGLVLFLLGCWAWIQIQRRRGAR